MSGLQQLKALLDSGEFHHATHRCLGTIWEGLYFYRIAPDSRIGYELVSAVNRMTSPDDYAVAIEMTRKTGISVEAFGQG